MLSKEELKELASQLKDPHGSRGVEVGWLMNESNSKMIMHCIDNMELEADNKVLELGYGNCGHLEYLFTKVNIDFFGIESSELMYEEAQKINADLIEAKKNNIHLSIFDRRKIPFEDEYFDRIYTINTIYFWECPREFIVELYRVLKPGGLLGLTFAQKNFMFNLPFVDDSFVLYDTEMIKELLTHTEFKIRSIKNEIEYVKNKSGKMVDREFTTIIIEK